MKEIEAEVTKTIWRESSRRVWGSQSEFDYLIKTPMTRANSHRKSQSDFCIAETRDETTVESQEMLRASRIVCASKRGFATVVDASAGFKVAAVDNGQPSSSVTVLLKAGSRYQSKPGVAHALSNFAFKVSVPSPHSMNN